MYDSFSLPSFYRTCCACNLKRASSWASFFVVRTLSRIDVRRTLCVRVFMLCDLRTLRPCASRSRLLSCSVFNSTILSLISGSSHISTHYDIKIQGNETIIEIDRQLLPAGVSSCLFFAFRSAPFWTNNSSTSNCNTSCIRFIIFKC